MHDSATVPDQTPAAVADAGQRGAFAGFGKPVASNKLDDIRGGSELVVNDMRLSGTVADNTANHVLSGSNAIADGSFASAAGLPTVIQNTGSNVLIQNATIINVQFKP
ncbi:periplasmic protein [Cupriavidus basilensis OR16]|uniref:Periplasmic protein n=2 Tax=Cupriavidus basilensis TaxID=68895 RepID=H1S4J4_9BURK|nr:periplasmic protein [Cupriavidus basilensis OR16]